jgi:hypothetical protein
MGINSIGVNLRNPGDKIMSTLHTSLDKIIAEQKAISEKLFGNSNAISEAVHAYDHFSEDELEQASLSNVTSRGN